MWTEVQVHARFQYWDRDSFDRACRLLEDKHQLGLVEVCPYGIYIPWANYSAIDRYLGVLFEGATGLAVWADLESEGRVLRDGHGTDEDYQIGDEDDAVYDDSDWWGWVDHVDPSTGWAMVLAWSDARDDSFHMRVRQFREPDDDEGVDYGNSEFNQALVGEFWLRNGKLHREDGPAVTTFRPDGDVDEEFWFLEGTQTGPRLVPTLSPDSGDSDSSTAEEEPHLWPARGPKRWPHLSTFVKEGPTWTNPEQLEEQIPAFVEGLPRYWYRQGEQVDFHEPVKRQTAHGESYFLRDGTLVAQNWLKDGDLHREDGPASIRYRPDGTVEVEEWHQHGHLHREDGPAITRFRPDGTVEVEEWHQLGRFHRDIGPTRVTYRPDGSPELEEWLHEAERHREGGPARVSYRPDGAVEEEEWYYNGQRHRVDGPASTSYYQDGTPRAVEWYRDGKRHREDGPARAVHRPDGTTEREEWYRDGALQQVGTSTRYVAIVDDVDPTAVHNIVSITTDPDGVETCSVRRNGEWAPSPRYLEKLTGSSPPPSFPLDDYEDVKDVIRQIDSSDLQRVERNKNTTRYLAIVDDADHTAVHDLVSITTDSAGGETCSVRRNGEWVPAPRHLERIHSDDPPTLVELTDQATVNNVVRQLDASDS